MRCSNRRRGIAESRKKRNKPLGSKGLCKRLRIHAIVYKHIYYPLGESNPCSRAENPMS